MHSEKPLFVWWPLVQYSRRDVILFYFVLYCSHFGLLRCKLLVTLIVRHIVCGCLCTQDRLSLATRLMALTSSWPQLSLCHIASQRRHIILRSRKNIMSHHFCWVN